MYNTYVKELEGSLRNKNRGGGCSGGCGGGIQEKKSEVGRWLSFIFHRLT